MTVLLECNAVGVIFARSLHYQFYTWYWHSIPFLLWRCERLPLAAKLATIALLEYAWSFGVDRASGTPTPTSAMTLQVAHLLLLAWRMQMG